MHVTNYNKKSFNIHINNKKISVRNIETYCYNINNVIRASKCFCLEYYLIVSDDDHGRN